MARAIKSRVRLSLQAIALLAAVVFQTSCSFIINFNLKNLSGEPIDVQYYLRGSGDGFDPQLVSEDGESHVPFPKEQIVVDYEHRVVSLKLLPNEEVILFSLNDKLDNNYEDEFNFSKLKISGATGSTAWEGKEAFKAFKPVKKSWYTFGPEITGFVLEYR